jgi:hypothetical protein
MFCCGDKKPYSKNALWFKKGFFGVMLAFVLTLLGMLEPFSQNTMQLPLAWVLAILILLPSVMMYYKTRDAFWAEVAAEKKEKEGGK